MYDAKVLADSITDRGVRLITVQATFPRFILAEVNTHRVFSRNSASSRAIPPDDKIDPETGAVIKQGLINKVRKNPFVPETFNSRVPGMGVGDEIPEDQAKLARSLWLEAAHNACRSAEALNVVGIDKSRINRLLEPFMWHTAIISATEWDNFFALRCPPGLEADINFPAQLEFQKVALKMREVMIKSKPTLINQPDQWHLPLVTLSEIEEVGKDIYMLNKEQAKNYWPMVSAGRCARVSYDTHENSEELYVSYNRAEKLMKAGHMSPFEHQARLMEDHEMYDEQWKTGNFYGWTQFRKTLANEENMVGWVEQRPDWELEASRLFGIPLAIS